jgi:predicted metal-binding protein
MRNKYPGKCYKCHKLVREGEGHFERYQYGWRVQHSECVGEPAEEALPIEEVFDASDFEAQNQ